MQRQSIALSDGRSLAYRIYGAPEGNPVFAFHGAPATSMMFEPADKIARSLNLKLICPDRPGYGGSSAAPDRGLDGWSEDVAALLSSLDIERFGIIGISGGGPYATSCAAAFGERVSALALVSPVGPMMRAALPRRLPLGFWLFFRRLPRRPRLLRAITRIAAHTQRRHSAASYRLFARFATASDKPLLALPHVEANMRTMTMEALAAGVEGALADMQVYGSDWTVNAARIRCRSVLWQGAADRIVPRIASSHRSPPSHLAIKSQTARFTSFPMLATCGSTGTFPT
jgi:pimeloyl-ACP methyl ester carboxylesterase